MNMIAALVALALAQGAEAAPDPREILRRAVANQELTLKLGEIGRASCRERV